VTIAKRLSGGRDDSIYSCFCLAVKLISEIQNFMKIQLWGERRSGIFLRGHLDRANHFDPLHEIGF
jgi:hypothetical protein